jgi:flagellar biosynthesis protein FliR
MNFQAEEIVAYLANFIWPFMRISAMFISIPVFSVRSMPARLKVMLSMLITFVVLPTLPVMPDIDLFSPEGFMVTLQQLFLGISTGFILQMVVSIM